MMLIMLVKISLEIFYDIVYMEDDSFKNVCVWCKCNHDIQYALDMIGSDFYGIYKELEYLGCDCGDNVEHDFINWNELDSKYVDERYNMDVDDGMCEDCIAKSGINNVLMKYKVESKGIDNACDYLDCNCVDDEDTDDTEDTEDTKHTKDIESEKEIISSNIMKYKLVNIIPSPTKNKRLRAIFSGGKKTDFGMKNSKIGTYIDHGNDKLRNAYRARHKRDLKTNDPTRAGYLSYYILWGDTTSLKFNISEFERKFNL